MTLLTLSGIASAASPAADDASSLARGNLIFTQQCASCHALALDAIGPPLGGITALLPREQLITWIRDPAKVIASGDARASALFARYKVMMPPFAHLRDDEIAAILAYIAHESATRHITAFEPDNHPAHGGAQRLLPPVEKSGLVIELEDYVQIPRLPSRTAYKGITILRPDPREDGALFVDELMGILYRVTKERELSAFLDVRPSFPAFLCDPGVASGLGSFALHPEFPSNGIFYTTHSETFRKTPAINSDDIPADVPPYETPPLEWVLTEWRLADPAAMKFSGTHREVLRYVAPTTGHNFQEMAFAPVSDPRDPDFGMLYIGCGDGGSINLRRPDMAGHVRSLLGAILRIDPAGHDGLGGGYGIPADNPFAESTDPSVHREIWAYGFRNAHRFSWDFAHGRSTMIAVDIGEANVEEVNLIEPGGSYGWGVRSIEGTFFIDPKIDAKVVRPATPDELDGIHLPFAAYDHTEGPAITGGYVYHGSIEALRDKYIFGDIVNGRIFFLNMGANLDDTTIREIEIVRDGVLTDLKTLAHADRAHLRLSYDDRTGDLYLLTKDDGMIRRVISARRWRE